MKLGRKQKDILMRAYGTSRKGLAAGSHDRRVCCERLIQLGLMKQDGDGSYTYLLTDKGMDLAYNLINAE